MRPLTAPVGGAAGPRRAGPRARLGRLAGSHPFLAVALLLVILDLALIFPALLGGRVLAPEDALLFNPPLSALGTGGLLHPSNYLLGDAVQVFHPDLEWARTMVRAGHLPLWDPDVFGGWPLLASQQTALLYPLTLLAYLLPFWPALGLIAVAKTLLAGLGTWWLCRRLRLGAPAAVLAAVVYSLGSYFVIWLEHPHTNVYALIPWLLGVVDLVCTRRQLADAGLLAAIVAACLLGGQPESAFIAAIGGLAFAGHCLTGLETGAERRRSLLLLAGAGLLGVAGGAVMIVPFAELAAQAPQLGRGGGKGLPPDSALSLLLPDLWGRPDASGFEVSMPANYAERTFYVGALPLMLAAAGLTHPRARAHRFFAWLGLGAAVLAVNVPVLTEAIIDLPGLSLVVLDRALILVALCLAVLAGFGLERLLAAAGGERRTMLAVAVAVVCLPILWFARHASALRAFPRFSDLAPSLWGSAGTQAQTAAAATTRWLVFALAGLAALAWLLRARARARPRQASLALAVAVALVAVDLLALDHGYHPAIAQARAAPAPTPSLVAARAAQGSGRTTGVKEFLIPNVASRYGLRDPRGHGLPALGRYLALWNGLGGLGFQATRLRPNNPESARLLDDFGVTQLLTVPGGRSFAGGLVPAATYPDATIYHNPGALPRAYVASSWRPAASRPAALAATIATPAPQLRTAPVIEDVDPDPTPGDAAQPAGTATFTEDGADEVALDVDAPRSGYLVLLDSYYPGWSATVDGRRTAIHPANEAFRAVAVSPGHHRVVFRYRPASVLAAAALSAAAWLAMLALVLRGRRRSGAERRARRRDLRLIAGPRRPRQA